MCFGRATRLRRAVARLPPRPGRGHLFNVLDPIWIFGYSGRHESPFQSRNEPEAAARESRLTGDRISGSKLGILARGCGEPAHADRHYLSWRRRGVVGAINLDTCDAVEHWIFSVDLLMKRKRMAVGALCETAFFAVSHSACGRAVCVHGSAGVHGPGAGPGHGAFG